MENKREGKNCILRWPTGKVYEGEFRNELPHGIGVLTKEDGGRVTGDW